MKKRILFILLALTMCLTLIPTAAFAEGEPTTNTVTTEAELRAALGMNGTGDIVKLGGDIEFPSESGGALEIDRAVTLDLNGHVLKRTDSGYVILVRNNLTLTDSNPTAAHYFTVDTDGLWRLCTESGCTHTHKTVTGGVITGGVITDVTNQNDGGVCISSGSFTMNGGNIVGCAANTYSGGGVWTNSGGTTFIMNGGSIVGCIAKDARANYGGGGVCIAGGSFTMNGGTIKDCKATQGYGGGVCIPDNDGNFTMNGGTITGCTAAEGGDGIYLGTKTLQDVVPAGYLLSGTGINMAQNACGDVTVVPCTHVDATGASTMITENTCTVCGVTCAHPDNKVNSATGKCACNYAFPVQLSLGGTTTWHSTVSSAVASVGSDSASGEITLVGNASGDATISSGTVTLDLNGKTLTGSLTVSGGNVTVNANGGKITGAVSLTGGYLTINGGTYGGTVTMDGGDLRITGGTFKSVTVRGGSATITGGSFEQIENSQTGGKVTDLLGENVAFATSQGESGVNNLNVASLRNVKVIEHYSHTASGESDSCSFCGKSLAASVTAAGGSKQYFETLEAALENVQNGQTVKLLRHATLISGTTISGKSITLDLGEKEICGSVESGTGTLSIADGAGLTLKGMTNGKLTVPVAVNGTLTVDDAVKLGDVSVTGGTITVNANATFNSLSITGGTATLNSGTFTTLSVGASETIKSKNFLGTGCAYYTTKWLTDTDLGVSSLSAVSVKELPIKSLSISTNGNKTAFAYGEDVVLTANVTCASGATPTYAWVNAGSTGQDLGSTQTITLKDLAPNADGNKYNILCTVTVGDYSRSEYIEFTVSKATLTGNYTAPTAKTGLTYTGSDQALINAGSFTTSISGPAFQYGMERNGVMQWSDVGGITGRSAGTYTVCWYIAGGDNYESVGSKESPAGTLTVTIAPKPVTATVDAISAQTYTGSKLEPTVTVKAGETPLTKDTDYTLTYGENINAGTNAGSVTVKAKSGSNYTFSDVTANFTINKAAAPTLTSYTVNQYYGDTTAQTFQLDLAKYGLPTGEKIQGMTVRSSKLFVKPDGVEVTTGQCSYSSAGVVQGSYTITGADEQDIGETVTLVFEILLENHESAEMKIVVTLTTKESKALAVGMTGWTYGDDANAPSYTAPNNATNLSVQYKAKDADDSTYSSTVPANAGNYTVKVSYETATEIWSGTADFTIEKKLIGGENSRTIVTLGDALTYNGTSQTQTVSKVELDGVDITAFCDITNATQTDAGDSYMLWVSAKSNSNYRGMVGKGFAVACKTITITGATISDKDYDGTTAATVTGVSFDGLANSETLELGIDYEVVSAAFPDADADESNVAVTMTVRLKDTDKAKNYSLSGGDYTAANAAKINKIDLPDDKKPAELSSLTGMRGQPLSTVSLPTGWTWDNSDEVMTATGNKTFNASYAGSTNYKANSSVTLTVSVSEKNSVSDKITFADGSLTYTGSALTFETATITGVSGGAWTYTYAADTGTLSDGKPLTAGTYTVTAKYEDATHIGTATATLTVAKATPTGEPKYTAITASGKKLSDANLTTESGTFSVEGAVKWIDADGNDLADTTEVAANTAYKWLFTPTDSTNYNTIEGSITLWSYTPVIPAAPSKPTVTVPVSSDHASVEVKAEVSKGNATVEVSDKQIEQVASNGAGNVTLDVSSLEDVESATVPSHVVEKTNEAENTGLTVALPSGSVTLDETALGSVTENANGKDVTVSVVSIPTTNLPPVVKDIIGMEPTVVAVVDVNITVGNAKQSSFSGGKVTISVPYTPKAGEDTSKLTVWFIKDDGTIENKGGYYDAEKKCFVFETEHLSQYLLVNTNELVSFTDVAPDAYYAAAVNWAAKQNITGGVGNNLFAPDASCTRAQIVTFLWRAAGSPESKAESSFADVPATAYYAKAVAWAVEQGITGGIGNNQFAPDQTCTRAQAVAFLFRYEAANGMDAVTLQELVGGYGDAAQVPSYALSAFNWALAKGIVQGYNGNLVPNNDCTRAQIVTMLYRLLG